MWERATLRRLSVGIRAGAQHAFEMSFSVAALGAMARENVVLGVTVYGDSGG